MLLEFSPQVVHIRNVFVLLLGRLLLSDSLGDKMILIFSKLNFDWIRIGLYCF